MDVDVIVRELSRTLRAELLEAEKKLEHRADVKCVNEYRTKVCERLTKAVEILLWEVEKKLGVDDAKCTVDLIISTIENYFPIEFSFGYGGYEDEKHPYWGKRLLYGIPEEEIL